MGNFCKKKPRTELSGVMHAVSFSAAYGILKFPISMFSSLIQTILSVPEFFL